MDNRQSRDWHLSQRLKALTYQHWENLLGRHQPIILIRE